jgi:IQ calmodulin-binding motif
MLPVRNCPSLPCCTAYMHTLLHVCSSSCPGMNAALTMPCAAPPAGAAVGFACTLLLQPSCHYASMASVAALCSGVHDPNMHIGCPADPSCCERQAAVTCSVLMQLPRVSLRSVPEQHPCAASCRCAGSSADAHSAALVIQAAARAWLARRHVAVRRLRGALEQRRRRAARWRTHAHSVQKRAPVLRHAAQLWALAARMQGQLQLQAQARSSPCSSPSRAPHLPALLTHSIPHALQPASAPRMTSAAATARRVPLCLCDHSSVLFAEAQLPQLLAVQEEAAGFHEEWAHYARLRATAALLAPLPRGWTALLQASSSARPTGALAAPSRELDSTAQRQDAALQAGLACASAPLQEGPAERAWADESARGKPSEAGSQAPQTRPAGALRLAFCDTRSRSVHSMHPALVALRSELVREFGAASATVAARAGQLMAEGDAVVAEAEGAVAALLEGLESGAAQ